MSTMMRCDHETVSCGAIAGGDDSGGDCGIDGGGCSVDGATDCRARQIGICADVGGFGSGRIRVRDF